MKELLTLAGAIFLTSVVHAENCPLENIPELEYEDLECQFYLGTTAFRNQFFDVAAIHWKYIIDSDDQESDDDYKTMALGTYAYLLYNGLGIKRDRAAAIKIWKQAAMDGDLESRKHLGFAYSDNDYIGKNLVVALGWYKSILLLHPTDEELDESSISVWQNAVNSVDDLEKKLSIKEIKKSVKYAKTTIE